VTAYYADYVNGNDANNGLGPDASHASNKPWKTLTKALGAAGIASGDTLYLSPAGPFRETVTVAMTSATAETKVLGDPANAQGFKTSGGVRVAAGPVVVTAWTTNDTTAPPSAACIDLAGRDYLTFQNIAFHNNFRPCLRGEVTQTSTNLTVRDCSFYVAGSGGSAITADGAFGTALDWLIERCVLFSGGGQSSSDAIIYFLNDTGSGADYDLGVTVRNSVLVGTARGIVLQSSGGLANKPGGILAYNNSFFLPNTSAIVTVGSGTSTSIPIRVHNNVIRAGTGVNAGTSGQIVEDYNHFECATTHTNVTPGGNSVTTRYAPSFHFGEERLVGANPRMFMEPAAGSWALTFGNDGTYTTAEDFLGLPRPGGGGSAVKGIGYLGRGNTFYRGTGTVRTGSNALEITGPGTQDFQLPVDAVSTTVTCYVRWDATYAGTKPQMLVLNCEEAGVTAATTTATGSSGNWEQLSLNFTPTLAGIVTVRLQSNDTNGAGKMFCDDFDVS
jgi:hypothetical protein